MRILVTGGAGFIGSHIVDKLLQNDYKVIIVDNLSSGSLENLPCNSNLKFYQKDILTDDLSEIFETEKPDFCIHLAAQTSVIKSIENPINDAELNITGTIKLIEHCKKYNIKKFVTASSAAVYGQPQYLPVDETHQTKPISYYGLSKLTMENYVKLSCIPYLIFRFANVYGPRQASSKESGVISIFNDYMIKSEPINIYGNGEQIRDFVYVEDIAEICTLAIKNDKFINQTLNISTNKGVSINELFNLMKNLYKYPLNATHLPTRVGDIKDSILSNTNLITLTPNYQFTDINNGVKKLREYYLKVGGVNA